MSSSDEAWRKTTVGIQGKAKEILEKYKDFEDGASARELNEEDNVLMRDIFQKYYEVSGDEEKFPDDDIAEICVTTAQYKSKCFAVILKDYPGDGGSKWRKFSYKNLKANPKQSIPFNTAKLTKSACRYTIQDQAMQFRTDNPAPPGYEVDHKRPCTFAQLYADFEGLLQKDYHKNLQECVEFDKWKDRVVFKDKPVERLWYDFHKKHAQFEMVSREENLRRHLQPDT